jgi:hypothetical protein
MNKESSRSHAVFTLTIQTKFSDVDGLRHNKTSQFNIVDLAGSERLKETGAEGQQKKEAGKIN